MLKLYKISQNVNNDYDTYDSAIIAAESEHDARYTYPSEYHDEPRPWNGRITDNYSNWCDAEYVIVELIGTAAPHVKPGVILGSFNAR